MAVYVTKSMLTSMNKLQLPSTSMFTDDGNVFTDHWHKLMDSASTIRLAKAMICRVCGKSGCTPISEKIYGYDIIGIIQSLTNVTMDNDDSLPKYICTDCLEMLKIAINFKRTCEASDRKFKKILNPNGDPLFHSYPYSKHDFQLILHEMKTRRTQKEEIKQKERLKRERERERKAPKIKQFKCSPCDITFPNKESLTAHRRERQCMRRACDICGQLVVSISQHMRHIHKQTVPHKCPTCGKEFPIIARLKTHMMVHTNTFNFFCDLCPYKSKHKYYLVMHMRTHTGEKPYKCSECPATFVNPSNLNKHKLTHQEKQFKCTLCDKAFRTTSGLREHAEAIHMNIKHTCQMCGRDFGYKTDLRKHEIRHHNRMKRDYIGGEPSYKQVERLQKHDDGDRIHKLPEVQTMESIDKWRTEEISVAETPTVLQITYMDPNKEYMQANMQQNNMVYFTDVQMMQQQPHLVPQHSVQLSLPELTMKKDEVKMYEPQQNIGYF